MAACLTIWPGMAGFYTTADCGVYRDSCMEVGRWSEIRASASIAKTCRSPCDISKLTQAPSEMLKRCNETVMRPRALIAKCSSVSDILKRTQVPSGMPKKLNAANDFGTTNEVGSMSVMRPRALIAKYSSVSDISNLNQLAPSVTPKKKRGHSFGFWHVQATSKGSEPNKPEEPVDKSPDNEKNELEKPIIEAPDKIKKLNIDVFLGMKFSFGTASSGANDLADGKEPEDFAAELQAEADKASEAMLEYFSRFIELPDELRMKRIDAALKIDDSTDKSSFGANDSTDDEAFDTQAQADNVKKQANRFNKNSSQVTDALLNVWLKEVANKHIGKNGAKK